jgi:hypothetical protein
LPSPVKSVSPKFPHWTGWWFEPACLCRRAPTSYFDPVGLFVKNPWTCSVKKGAGPNSYEAL